MIKLRLQPSGAAEQIVEVPGDSATIGRTQGCDVVINQPYLSKRHVRILHGTVAVDLGSSNGTFVKGERIREATLLEDGKLTLGNDDLRIVIETEDSDPTAVPAHSRIAAAPAPAEIARLELDVERLRSRNVLLELDVERLTRERAASPGNRALESQLEELRTENMRLTQRAESSARDTENASLRGERDTAKAEVGRLRTELDAVQRAAAQARQLSDTVLRLRAEIEKLRSPPAPSSSPSSTPGDNDSRVRILQREVERLQSALAARAPAPAVVPVPATPLLSSMPSGVGNLLRTLVDDDIGARAPLLRGAPDEFLVLEQFRFLRQVERVVTRMAAEFIQLYQAHTVLPDTEGNFRGLASAVFVDPASLSARQELVKYVEELSKWLVVSLAAHRSAAARFAEQLKSDLSERALIGDKQIGGLTKLVGKSEAELWRRASAYLRELTPDTVDDRLEKLARDAAGELLDRPKET